MGHLWLHVQGYRRVTWSQILLYWRGVAKPHVLVDDDDGHTLYKGKKKQQYVVLGSPIWGCRERWRRNQESRR